MKPVYIKFNSNRKSKFILRTVICVDGPIKYTLKLAESKDSYQHLQEIYANYEYLSKADLPFDIAKADMHKDGVRFQFIQGKTILGLITEALHENDERSAIKYIQNFINTIKSISIKSNDTKIFFTDKIFDKNNLECFQDYIYPGILDLNLDNLIANQKKLTLIDYEWVIKSYLPTNYVIFRAISNLLNLLTQKLFDTSFLIPLFEEYFSEDSIKLEYQFQSYVNIRPIDYNEFKNNYYNLLVPKKDHSFSYYTYLKEQVITHKSNYEVLKADLLIKEEQIERQRKILRSPILLLSYSLRKILRKFISRTKNESKP